MAAEGGAILLECLWELGDAVTDPGIAAYRPSVRLFDPFQGAEPYEIANRLKCVPTTAPQLTGWLPISHLTFTLTLGACWTLLMNTHM